MSLGLQKVIFSITSACNFNCKFCFPSHGAHCVELSDEDKVQIINELAVSGCREITFIGGEPTLYTKLGRLIKIAKRHGMVTKIVTNGSSLTELFLEEMESYLDCITLSVDSLNKQTLETLGRQCRNMAIDSQFYYDVVRKVRNFSYKLRVNTVVTSKNLNENLVPFINYAAPQKWKIFQMVSVDGKSSEFAVSDKNFIAFCKFHKKNVTPATLVSVNPAALIKGSCTMINHAGRFFDIANGNYNYSFPILDVGVERAFAQVTVVEAKVLHKMQQAS